MAKLSFGVNGPSQNWTVELEIANTDSPRILTWLSSPDSGYGTVTENIQYQSPDPSWSPGEDETEADRPTISMQKWETRQATPEEAATNYAKATLASLLNSTVAWDKAKAAEKAAADIPEINPV